MQRFGKVIQGSLRAESNLAGKTHVLKWGQFVDFRQLCYYEAIFIRCSTLRAA